MPLIILATASPSLIRTDILDVCVAAKERQYSVLEFEFKDLQLNNIVERTDS
jgi:hypothetical protein